jgi:hypothetical protein
MIDAFAGSLFRSEIDSNVWVAQPVGGGHGQVAGGSLDDCKAWLIGWYERYWDKSELPGQWAWHEYDRNTVNLWAGTREGTYEA